MNDNTIIRIKVPAHLYESVKAKLMIKENFEAPVKEEQEIEETPAIQEDMGVAGAVITAISTLLGVGLPIAKALYDDLHGKSPEEQKKVLQSLSGQMTKMGAGLNEAKKEDPKKAAEDKKKAEAKKKEDAKKAEDKKKKEAEAKKKVAEKKK
jgi:hypothetical protein